MGLTSLHDFYGSWHLYISRSLFGHSTFSVASLVFVKGTLCCVIGGNFKWIEPLDLVYMISAVICMSLREVWHLCNLPCVYSFFWLVSIASYVSKSPSICFQRTKYEINREDVVHLHCTFWRRARLCLELLASTVVDSYHEYHICPRTFFFGDAVALLWDRFTFSFTFSIPFQFNYSPLRPP